MRIETLSLDLENVIVRRELESEKISGSSKRCLRFNSCSAFIAVAMMLPCWCTVVLFNNEDKSVFLSKFNVLVAAETDLDRRFFLGTMNAGPTLPMLDVAFVSVDAIDCG